MGFASRLLGLCAWLGLACSGCSAISANMPGNKKHAKEETRLSEEQAVVMRFADSFADRLSQASTQAQRSAETPDERLAVQNWQLGQTTAAYVNATGPSPVVNVLDMVVLATLDRMVVEDYWMRRNPQLGLPLLHTHRRLEHAAWTLADDFLSPAQSSELRDMIDEFRMHNPLLHTVAFIHFTDFAKAIGKTPVAAGGSSSGGDSLFAAVGLDPLANLDPAVKELAKSRLLAERALFYAQRWPMLLEMQVESVSYQTASMPEAQRLLSDVDEVSDSVQRVSSVVHQLPQVIAEERRAAIDQVFSELDGQERHARKLLSQTRGVLEAGTGTATALQGAADALDKLLARVEKKKQPDPHAKPSKPFDINEYTRAAAELSHAAGSLDGLLASVDAQAPKLERAAQTAAATSKQVIDYAFIRALCLLAVALFGGFAAAVGYRYATFKLRR